MINEVSPMMDMLKRMVENGDDKAKIVQFIDSISPEIQRTLLRSEILTCKNCELHECNHTSFEGSIHTDIMFVGEAPGGEEEKSGKPFVGPAGAIFNNMIGAAAEKLNPRWNREDVYVTNSIKCRPMDNANESNRAPNAKEIASCKRILDKEIQMVKPKVIVCVGGIAANTLIHPGFKITEEHGKFFGDGPKMIAIYHPSYVLRTGEATPEGVKLKTEMWQDLQMVNAYLDSLK